MTARSSAAVLQARTLRIKSRNFIAMVGVVCEVYCIDHKGFSPTHSTPDLTKRRLITRMCSWRPLGTNESPSIYPWLARPIFLSWMVWAPCYCWSLCPQYIPGRATVPWLTLPERTSRVLHAPIKVRCTRYRKFFYAQSEESNESILARAEPKEPHRKMKNKMCPLLYILHEGSGLVNLRKCDRRLGEIKKGTKKETNPDSIKRILIVQSMKFDFKKL